MDPENNSSLDTVPSEATDAVDAVADSQTKITVQEPASPSDAQPEELSRQPGQQVQQARTSITALTSLFDDPVTLKPREKAEGDESLAGAMLTMPRNAKQSAQAARAKIARALEDADAAPASKEAARLQGEAATDPVVDNSVSADGKSDEAMASGPRSEEANASPDGAASNASPSADASETKPTLSPDQQVRIKRYEDHLALIFPREQKVANPDVTVDFVDSELWQQLQQRLSGGERSWKVNTPVHLNAQDHLLDSRQLQELGEALDRYDLKLTRVATSRRQTAVAAATAGFSIDQGAELPLVALTGEAEKAKAPSLATEPLYLQTTVRSGAEIRHPGSVIIMGDLNPGSSVVADGDILVWGKLRGVAHAGASGNKNSIILALKMEPTQLRIADALARVASAEQGQTVPEVAYVTAKNDIRITEATGFTRPYR